MMRDQLLKFYEAELDFLRHQLTDFAKRNPAIASQLLLEPDRCEDPHVERLIESFAMLASRVKMRLDDDFPEISTAFLGMVHPGFLSSIPSATLVQFVADADRAQETTGTVIPRHSQIYAPAVKGVRCRFRTCYPVTLWPIEVSSVEIIGLDKGSALCPPNAVAAIRISLSTLGSQTFSQLDMESIRFFFDGDAATAHRLYELFFCNPLGVIVRPNQDDIEASRVGSSGCYLKPEVLQPVGFAADEGLVEGSDSAHLGHRLLQEYFAFPEKFLFGEIKGLGERTFSLIKNKMEILVLLDRLPLDIEAKGDLKKNLSLGCTPAINLFTHQAEPITRKYTQSEYRIIAEAGAQDSYEVHSIQSVETLDARTGLAQEFRPFYSLRHGDPDENEMAFWQSSMRPGATSSRSGIECYLTLVDAEGCHSTKHGDDTLLVRILATNSDLPASLPFSSTGGGFAIEGQPGIEKVTMLRSPTSTIRAPWGQGSLWRLISLLSLNYLSLLEVKEDDRSHDGGGPVAFRELMSVLDFADTSVTRRRIAGLKGLQWRPVVRQIATTEGKLLTRGLEITLNFEKTNYTQSSVFMFASILEKFLAHYTSINSFTQTVATVNSGEEVLKQWKPRAGEDLLL